MLAMCLSLAEARLRADCPSGKAPTTRVRRRISRMIRSSGLLVRNRLVDPALDDLGTCAGLWIVVREEFPIG